MMPDFREEERAANRLAITRREAQALLGVLMAYAPLVVPADPRLAVLYVVARAKLDYIAVYGS